MPKDSGVSQAFPLNHANSPLVSTVSHRYAGNNRMVTTKQYDFINRLSSIANGTGDSHAYGYNAANQRTNVVRADGSYWVYAYDNLGQVTSCKRYWSDGTPVAGQQHEYVFDDIGNRTSAKSGGNSSGTGLRTETYTRNRLNQYTQKDEANTFDVLGLANVSATVTVNGSSAYRKNEYFHKEVSVSNGSNPVWQAVSTIASLGGTTTTNTGNMYVAKTPEVLTYDLDGNQLTDGRWSNTWDAENRLILQETIGTVPTGARKRLIHKYDWMGRRIRKQAYDWVASAWSLVKDERFLYDGWNVVAILNSATTIQQTQLWGKDLSGSMQGAGGVGGLLALTHYPSAKTYFTGYDGNGNVTVLIDGVSGLTEGNFEYGPFGELIRASGTAVAVCPWRFSTKYEDAETGQLYYGYRFYNPNTGRWMSRDPIGERGGLNLFAFLSNEALSAVDPFGLAELSQTCGSAVDLWRRIDTMKQNNPKDLRISFLEIQACILSKLCAGACCPSAASLNWLNRVVGTFMKPLFDALDGNFYDENSGWESTFNKVNTAGAVSSVVDLVTDHVGGNLLDPVVNYPAQTAADREMALTHDLPPDFRPELS